MEDLLTKIAGVCIKNPSEATNKIFEMIVDYRLKIDEEKQNERPYSFYTYLEKKDR